MPNTNTAITYPVSAKRPVWRDGQRFLIVDANGREIAKESQWGTAGLIAADMNAAEEGRRATESGDGN